MGKKAASKKSSAAEATNACDNEHQDDNTVFPPSPDPTTSSHGDAESHEEEAVEQPAPSKRRAKQKKAPAANMSEKPSPAAPAKGSECDTGAKKGLNKKKSAPPSNSTAIPVMVPTVRPASAKEASFVLPLPLLTTFYSTFN